LALAAGLAFALKTRNPLVEVVVARATGEARAETLLNASGYVTPRRRATVAAKITGRVEQIYAEEGLRVEEGQVLALLDCSQARASLASAKAERDATAAALGDLQVQLANAEREQSRAQTLRSAGVVSQEMLDRAQTSVDSLRSKIELGREQIRASESKDRDHAAGCGQLHGSRAVPRRHRFQRRAAGGDGLPDLGGWWIYSDGNSDAR
jgi:multidrug efflux pump subunit AcrA (membrane-fusion protein)